MADLWQQNGILIGVALAVAVVLLIVLLSKGRRKVQIEREETPTDAPVKRNQALIDLPPAASANPLVTPVVTPVAAPVVTPAIAPEPSVVAQPVPAPAPASAEPVAAAPTPVAAAQVEQPSSNTSTIVAPMPTPDPVNEPSVVVQTAAAAREPVVPAVEADSPAPTPVPAPVVPAAEPTMATTAPAPEPAQAPAAAQPLGAAPEAPARSGPDELTRIKGLGPKLADTLHALGVVSFAQIAAWDEPTIDRIDDQLGRFKGRIRRDNWVEQARLLAEGDITVYEDRFGKI